MLNTFSKGLARCSGSNWVFFPDPNWLCAPGANNVYAHTREECEEKLKVLIIEMKTELAELKRQKAEGTLPPQAPEGKKGPKKTKENK